MALAIYHFLIFHISFANLKNFGFLRFQQHSRNLEFSESLGCVTEYAISDSNENGGFENL